MTKKLRYHVRNKNYVQPPADEELIQEQREEIDRLNQLLVDMQDSHDAGTDAQPRVPGMRPLEVRLVNVRIAAHDEHAECQSSDNQNNIVDSSVVTSDSEEEIDDMHSILKLRIQREHEENVRLQQCLKDAQKASEEKDRVVNQEKLDSEARIAQLVDQLAMANNLLLKSRNEGEKLRLEIFNLKQDSEHNRARPPPVLERPKRKSREELEQEKSESLAALLQDNNDETRGLEVRDLSRENKGRAVFSTRAFAKGSFVVEYAGDLCNAKEAMEREKRYAKDPTKGCFSFFFKSG